MMNASRENNSAGNENNSNNDPTGVVELDDSDIVEVDVGGQLFKTTFGTLRQVEESLLARMFSSPWFENLKRDSTGRVFLDYNAKHFGLILEHLRMKKIEDPFNPAELRCDFPAAEKGDFDRLLQYLGLFEMVYPRFHTLDIPNIVVKQHDGVPQAGVTKTDEKIEFLSVADAQIAMCNPALDSSGLGCVWKIMMEQLGRGFLLGITPGGPADILLLSSDGSRYDKSYRDFVADSWPGFSEGECVYFHLVGRSLTMFSVQKNQKFTPPLSEAWTVDTSHLFFVMPHPGVKVVLEPVKHEEAERIFIEK